MLKIKQQLISSFMRVLRHTTARAENRFSTHLRFHCC